MGVAIIERAPKGCTALMVWVQVGGVQIEWCHKSGAWKPVGSEELGVPLKGAELLMFGALLKESYKIKIALLKEEEEEEAE